MQNLEWERKGKEVRGGEEKEAGKGDSQGKGGGKRICMGRPDFLRMGTNMKLFGYFLKQSSTNNITVPYTTDLSLHHPKTCYKSCHHSWYCRLGERWLTAGCLKGRIVTMFLHGKGVWNADDVDVASMQSALSKIFVKFQIRWWLTNRFTNVQ